MKKAISSLLILASSFAFAHGSDQPGPHGGFIEMPGAFHTEVVPEKEGSFKIYLLDINFKNPTVKDSSVEAWTQQGSKKSALKCQVQEDHFKCEAAGKSLKGEKLLVKAKREQMQGNEASYKLPLLPRAH